MAKVTIEDITRETGLSRGTVSRALNNRPDINPRTKRRVLDACRQLNYLPSQTARSLATGRNFALAVLVDDLHSAFVASFLRGVIAQAREARYAVQVTGLGEGPDQQALAVRAVVSDRIDSILLAAPVSAEAIAVLNEAGNVGPLVSTAPLEGIAADVLAPDERESGRLAARHLLQTEARELLYAHAPGSSPDRFAGFQEVCAERRIAYRAISIEPADGGPITTDDSLVRDIAGARAIAAADDYLALRVTSLCWRAGLKPGSDVAIIGQGNERAGTSVSPTLTTIDLSGEEIGRRAAATALQRIDKSRMDAPQITHVAPRLIVRDSTRHVASA